MNQQQQQYDPFLIPPILEFSLQHAKAKQVGFLPQLKQNLCQCCNMQINKIEIGLCVDLHKLQFLGVGFQQFFESIKYYSILLVVIFSLVGIYNIKTTSDLCYKEYHFTLMDDQENELKQCYHFIGVAYTLNKTNTQLTIQVALSLIGTILITICLIIVKYYLNKDLNYINECSVSDFSILIKNYPSHYDSPQIIEYLQKYFNINPSAVIKIIRPLNVEDYLADQQKKIQLLTKQQQLYASMNSAKDVREMDFQLKQIMLDIQTLDKQMDLYRQQISFNEKIYRTNYVIVILKEDHDVYRILSQSQHNTCLEKFFDCIGCCELSIKNDFDQTQQWKFINNERIYITEAPQPLDIIWQNLNISHSEKRLNRIKGVLKHILIIIIGGCVIYGISFTQNKAQNSNLNQFYVKYILSGLCALAVLVINIILEKVVKLTAEQEKHSTYTNHIRSIVITQTIMQFINTALIPFGLFIFTDFDQNNLVASLFFIFFGNMIILPLMEIFDPFYLLQVYKRYKVKNTKEKHRISLTQYQQNKLFEGPDYNIADKYSTIFKSILTSIFYLCMFPYGILMQVFSLFLYYWCCKYTLLRRCSFPPNLNSDLNDFIVKIMTISPILLAVGSICNDFVLIGTYQNIIMHIFNLIISSICVAVQYYYRFKFKVLQTESAQCLDYSIEQSKFTTDYDKCNPITMKQAQFQEQYKQE